MEVKEQPKLSFLGFDVVKFVLESYTRFDPEKGLKLKLVPKVFFPKEALNEFKIIFDVEVSSTEDLKIELLAIGNFKLIGEIDKGIRNQLVHVNAPAIMFPYVRAYVSTVTSNSGAIGTITIPPHFFKGNLPEITDLDINAISPSSIV